VDEKAMPTKDDANCRSPSESTRHVTASVDTVDHFSFLGHPLADIHAIVSWRRVIC
jgi:hypothetical protein